MIYKGSDNYRLEGGEPYLRSCPECNPAHKHLMDTDYFHICFECGRSWIFGRYLDEFNSAEEMGDFLKGKLRKFKEHKPYATCIKINLKKSGEK